jgi:hypothetical protein
MVILLLLRGAECLDYKRAEMKLKIVSDGVRDNKVFDENGNMIEGVVSIVWEARTGCFPKATLELVGIPIVATSQAKFRSKGRMLRVGKES